MLLDPNETANWIPYVIPLGPTTESHIIRYLFPERSLGRVPVDLAFATTMHLPFNESIFPENSGICALLFYMELLKCHSIFVRFFISSNKFVDPSIVIFKPTGYFPSSSCHLNCRRFSTLDELLFYNVPVFPNTFRHSTTKQYPCCRNGK